MKFPATLSFALAAAACLNAQDSLVAGRKTFENRCSGCHGADGNGGELGPPIAGRAGLPTRKSRLLCWKAFPPEACPPMW